ncbi:hypothetical protein SAMN05444166_2401 [Singulisphaera sp. GP187]|uniref:hypothetical protein n=1 Tax=Singulisphaera sp. GP187 TaxID=1882752 RepID=UPI000929E34A|nr:hypothetical protein [Singulisphaera sp. GP187]SIO09206.1 hypothetical protein SAMN05444166_2401 [Singulisphaera sp. GP187]
MNASGRSIWFVGDLDDPWVVAIVDALPRAVLRVNCAGEWSDGLLHELPDPATLVIHRTLLTRQDADRLARLRKDRATSLRVILCVGPHVRYADLLRWSVLVDVVLPEATARETIARHLVGSVGVGVGEGRGDGRGTTPRPSIDVVSSNYELREALGDVCASAGYPIRKAVDWNEVEPGGLAIWDVPVLEPDWGRTLARRAQVGTVVALIGLADRGLVGQARAQGASACLELPCDPADLIDVLDRLGSSARSDRTHEVPPPPRVLRRGQQKVVVEPGNETYNELWRVRTREAD